MCHKIYPFRVCITTNSTTLSSLPEEIPISTSSQSLPIPFYIMFKGRHSTDSVSKFIALLCLKRAPFKCPSRVRSWEKSHLKRKLA